MVQPVTNLRSDNGPEFTAKRGSLSELERVEVEDGLYIEPR